MLEYIKILGIIVALLLLPGFMQYVQADEANKVERILAPYPEQARLAYMRSCVGSSRGLIPHCKCMLNALEKRYTIEEMIRITKAPSADQAKYADALAKHCAKKK